jgi:predicted transposase YdaD
MQIESEKHMPYVTSIERLAKDEGKIEGKLEGKLEGKIQLLQDLLGLPIISDSVLAGMTAQQLEALYTDLRQRVDSR